MSTVTGRNKKPSNSYNLRCSATGLFLSDATSDFKVIAVTHRQPFAFVLPCEDAADHARKFMKSLYGSFDWQSVPVEG
jgi:hypothetical protein